MKVAVVRAALAAGFATLLPWSAPASAQDAPLTVTVELGDVSLTKLPFVMAAESGIYKRNGLEVRQYITPNAAELIRRSSGLVVPKDFVGTGVGDINIGGGSPTIVRMTTVATAPQRVILATTDHYSRYHILARAGIKTPDDIKGKRVGYGNFGALNHFSLMVYFKQMGIDPEKDVSMFSGAQEIHNIIDGQVDVVAGNGNTVVEATKKGLNDLVNLIPMKMAMPGSGVNADKQWLAKNREAAKRFVKATVEAIAMTTEDKPKALASMRKWYGINDEAMLEVVYSEAADLPRKPYPSIEGLKNMQSVYKWREMAKYKPEDFIDASFVTEFDKSGYIDSLYKKAEAAATPK